MGRGLSPTQRTLASLRQRGMHCAIVENWNPYAGPLKFDGSRVGIRQDLFGIIDIIALDPDRGIVGIQSCGDSYSRHLRKLLVDHAEATSSWLGASVWCRECGARMPASRLELWAWRKVKLKRGSKAMVWRPRIREIRPEEVGR